MDLSARNWLVVVCMLLGGCEVIADFDREKLDEQRTVAPTPVSDGAVALMPDAASMDGALIGPARDADLDPVDAADVTELNGLDASPLP